MFARSTLHIEGRIRKRSYKEERVSYKLGFDGDVAVELEKLVLSVERGLNGFGLHAQTSDTGASTATGSTEPPCFPGPTCPDSVKTGHDLLVALVVKVAVVTVALAISGGALAGYLAGKVAAGRQIALLKNGRD